MDGLQRRAPTKPGRKTQNPGKPAIQYRQKGTVWQAEEVRIGDRWQRYFGFVGAGGMNCVPADQIAFTTDWRSYQDIRDLEVAWQGIKPENDFLVCASVALGEPVRVGLGLENRKGTEQPSAAFVRGSRIKARW